MTELTTNKHVTKGTVLTKSLFFTWNHNRLHINQADIWHDQRQFSFSITDKQSPLARAKNRRAQMRWPFIEHVPSFKAKNSSRQHNVNEGQQNGKFYFASVPPAWVWLTRCNLRKLSIKISAKNDCSIEVTLQKRNILIVTMMMIIIILHYYSIIIFKIGFTLKSKNAN